MFPKIPLVTIQPVSLENLKNMISNTKSPTTSNVASNLVIIQDGKGEFRPCPASVVNAAPELLEALKNLLGCTELNMDDMEIYTRDIIRDAQCVIVRAEGKGEA